MKHFRFKGRDKMNQLIFMRSLTTIFETFLFKVQKYIQLSEKTWDAENKVKHKYKYCSLKRKVSYILPSSSFSCLLLFFLLVSISVIRVGVIGIWRIIIIWCSRFTIFGLVGFAVCISRSISIAGCILRFVIVWSW